MECGKCPSIGTLANSVSYGMRQVSKYRDFGKQCKLWNAPSVGTLANSVSYGMRQVSKYRDSGKQCKLWNAPSVQV